ncbi:uncharacterized protein LOC118767527 [Octopus sinensis]|uniref:Uncharacterized protein LOC118767527 n=1 Tax=Octopus sinensis TaxID=2607531 RepID=A0A7E6FL37_9MOLL|nr:uncharacterized protein LOC118767527 [Octopus sinensis]
MAARTIKTEKVFLLPSYLGRKTTRIRVKRIPPDIEAELVVAAILIDNKDKVDILQATIADEGKWKGGVLEMSVQAEAEVLERLTEVITIGDISLRVWVEGRARKCFKCGLKGHKRANCPPPAKEPSKEPVKEIEDTREPQEEQRKTEEKIEDKSKTSGKRKKRERKKASYNEPQPTPTPPTPSLSHPSPADTKPTHSLPTRKQKIDTQNNLQNPPPVTHAIGVLEDEDLLEILKDLGEVELG